jgi:hypothetical protein
VTATNPNHEAIREIDEKIENLVNFYDVTTEVIESCSSDDARVAHIDGFDLMEWRYLLRERASLLTSPEPTNFCYQVTSPVKESELHVGEYEEKVAA